MKPSEKGFSQTMVSFWVRLMRNKLYMKTAPKFETLVEYLKHSIDEVVQLN
jgi:hypothetical protein